MRLGSRSRKICIVKGACFRLKQIPNKIKKYSKKVTKPVSKQIDKLINPVVKRLLKSLKNIPGLDALQKIGAKVAKPFGKIGDLFKELARIQKLNLSSYKSRLQAISAELDALKQGAAPGVGTPPGEARPARPRPRAPAPCSFPFRVPDVLRHTGTSGNDREVPMT